MILSKNGMKACWGVLGRDAELSVKKKEKHMP